MHNIIRALRKEKGLTQQQVADYLHLDRSTYAYYESGRNKLNVDIIVKLAHFYQIRYAVLLGPEPMSARYEDAPANVQQKVIEEAAKRKEAED